MKKTEEVKDLKNKPPAELRSLLKENREKLRVLQFDLVAGKIKNINELRILRKTIARTQTFLNFKAKAK